MTATLLPEMTDEFDRFLSLTSARIGPDSDPWIDSIATIVDELAERWELKLGHPMPGGSVGYTVGAVRSGVEPVVLKVTYPDGWFAEEIGALAAWEGEGAVRLIDYDPRGAQLLERAEPGSSLLEEADEDRALEVAAGVLERLWVTDPGGIATVASEVSRWADSMPDRHDAQGRPFERALVHEAVTLLRDLAPRQGDRVLLHGDLHMRNVLAAAREPWLAIDPKPLVGEREFDVTALIRDRCDELVADPSAGLERLQHRIDLLSERLACDRGRLKGWAIAVLVDYALWDYEVGDEEVGEQQAELARMHRDLRV